MRNWSLKAAMLVMAVCLVVGCNESMETNHGVVNLALDAPESSNGRIDLTEIKSVFITIENEDGGISFEKEISLLRFNHHFITESISLAAGDYKVTRFLVLNESDETLYATPTAGSALAHLVGHPLPVDFKVAGDEVKSVHMEVVSTEGHEPSDFGYAKFSFSIVDPCDEVTAMVDGSSWCGMGTYVVAYGNQPPLLVMWFKNKNAMMSISSRYTGLGEYDLSGTDSDYYAYGTTEAYDVVSGKLVITHAPSATNSEISGTFHMTLKNPDGDEVEIKEGKFTHVPGLGY
jgi:hypothetical protein